MYRGLLTESTHLFPQHALLFLLFDGFAIRVPSPPVNVLWEHLTKALGKFRIRNVHVHWWLRKPHTSVLGLHRLQNPTCQMRISEFSHAHQINDVHRHAQSKIEIESEQAHLPGKTIVTKTSCSCTDSDEPQSCTHQAWKHNVPKVAWRPFQTRHKLFRVSNRWSSNVSKCRYCEPPSGHHWIASNQYNYSFIRCRSPQLMYQLWSWHTCRTFLSMALTCGPGRCFKSLKKRSWILYLITTPYTVVTHFARKTHVPHNTV